MASALSSVSHRATLVDQPITALLVAESPWFPPCTRCHRRRWPIYRYSRPRRQWVRYHLCLCCRVAIADGVSRRAAQQTAQTERSCQ